MSSATLKIVKISPMDADQAYPVHAACFSEEAADYLGPESFNSLVQGRGTTLLGVFQPENTGAAGGYILYRQIRDEAELLSLAIHPKARKKGLATALMNEMLADLRKNRVESVFLEVDSTNIEAIGVYKRLGFTPCGTRKAYYGNKKDAEIMKIALC